MSEASDIETTRFDVVIYDVTTGVVKSLAALNLKVGELSSHWSDTVKYLQPHLYAHPVEAGTKPPGSMIEEMTVGRRERLDALSRSPKRKVMQFANPQRRRENSVCIICESPSLATAIHCQRCATNANKATSRANRVAREPGE